jgi:hypothetical protein
MKIFSMLKKDEKYSEINYPLGGLRLKLRAVTPHVFERACIVSQWNSLWSTFEGETPL